MTPGEKKIEIIPPDPLDELGSGYANINTASPTPTPLTVQGRCAVILRMRRSQPGA